MPVLDTCGNVYDASWQQLDSFLFPFLIISSAAYADKHLSAGSKVTLKTGICSVETGAR